MHNPACGYVEAESLLANGTVHEGAGHVAPNVDGFFTMDKKLFHGPEFAKFAKLATEKTGIPITIKMPRVPNQALLLELMMKCTSKSVHRYEFKTEDTEYYLPFWE